MTHAWWRRRAAMVWIALLAAVSAGEGRADAGERPRFGGEAVVAGHDPVDPSLDPLLLDGPMGRTLSRALYDTLYRIDRGGHAVPHLLGDASVEDDSRALTFTLKPGLKFHDGSAVTAADVRFSLQRFFASGAARGGCALAADRAGAPAIAEDGRYGLRIRLAKPCPHLADELADPRAGIMPARAADAAQSQPVGGIGSGPFRLTGGEPDPSDEHRWVLTEHDAHVLGRPFLDRVVVKELGSATEIGTALRIGEVDVALESRRGADDTERWRAGGSDTVFLVLPGNVAQLSSADVRRALARAIDRKSIADVMLGGHATVARSALPEERAAYRTLLADSSPVAAGGVAADEHRAPLALGVSRDDAGLVEIAERVQANLDQVGWPTRMTAVEDREAPDELAAGHIGAWLTSVRLGDGASSDVLPRLFASLLPAPAAQVVASATAAVEAPSLELAERALFAAESALRADAVWIPVVHREVGITASDAVEVADVSTDGSIRLETLWRRPQAPADRSTSAAAQNVVTGVEGQSPTRSP